MSTLFDAKLSLAGFMTPLDTGESTQNSQIALVDSTANFSADQVGGTIFVLSGALEGYALKVNEKASATRLDFTDINITLKAGDSYAVANKDYPNSLLTMAVNEALRSLPFTREEDDVLETVDGQAAYALPEGIREVMRVWKATNLTEPYEFQELYHWDDDHGELRFPVGWEPAGDGYKLKLEYVPAWERLTDDADELPAKLDEQLIHWQAAVWLCRDAMSRYQNDPKRDLGNKTNEALTRLGEKMRGYHKPKRSARPADY